MGSFGQRCTFAHCLVHKEHCKCEFLVYMKCARLYADVSLMVKSLLYGNIEEELYTIKNLKNQCVIKKILKHLRVYTHFTTNPMY